MLVCRHPGVFFEMKKIELILFYNIFVTKKIFWGMNIKNIFSTCKFLVDPVGWRQTNIFLSLTLLHVLQVTLTDIRPNKFRKKKEEKKGKKKLWWLSLWKLCSYLSADSRCHSFHINTQPIKTWIKKTMKNRNHKLTKKLTEARINLI